MGCSESSTNRKVVNAYIKKKKVPMNNQNLCLKELEINKLNQSQQNERNNKVRGERNRE